MHPKTPTNPNKAPIITPAMVGIAAVIKALMILLVVRYGFNIVFFATTAGNDKPKKKKVNLLKICFATL
jgi:hypothetical protein